MKKSVKDQTIRAFQVGGYNPPSVPQQPVQPQTPRVNPRTGTYTLGGSGISGYLIPGASPTGYTPYGGATPYFQPVQFTGAQYQTATEATNLPTFAQTVGGGAPGEHVLYTCTNDAGQVRQIAHKDGKPIIPIPEGYVCRAPGSEQQSQPDTPAVTPTLGEAQVRDEGGGDRDTGVVGTGYKGLSRSTTSKSGGISEAAAKAKADLGITGFTGHSIGSIAGFVGTALGIPGSMSLAGKESMGYIGAQAAQSGMTGTLDQGTLEAIARGDFVGATGQSAIGLSQSQAQAVLDAQYNYNVQLNGLIGYTTGSISPNYGTPVRNGMTVDSAFGPNSQPEYASVADMINTVTKGINSGWRGGYVSQDTYNNMTPEQQANYNNFDPTFENRADEAKADAALEGMTGRGEEDATKGEIAATEAAIESMTSGKGIPADVQAEIDAAMAAHEAKSGKGDSPSSPSKGSYGDLGQSPGAMGGSTGPDGGGGSSAGDPSGGAGEGSGTDCLTENMKVKLNGVIDFVTNIKVGDIIDGSVVKEVLHKHMRSGYFVINNELEITNDHPVLANGTWTKPEELYIGDYINDVKVESIKYIDRMTPTVSIVVDGDSFDVYTKGNTYTVHGRYREVRKQAA